MKPISTLAAFCLPACFLVSLACLEACRGSGDRHAGGAEAQVLSQAGPVASPCAIFSEDIAQGLGNGPYEPGREAWAAGASLCLRLGGPGAPLEGATARFERMSRADFLAHSCRTPQDPETGAPLYELDTLSGIHQAACLFKPFGHGKVGLQVLTEDGWAVTVSSSTREKCLEAIEAMIPRLPKPDIRGRSPAFRKRAAPVPATRLVGAGLEGAAPTSL